MLRLYVLRFMYYVYIACQQLCNYMYHVYTTHVVTYNPLEHATSRVCLGITDF